MKNLKQAFWLAKFELKASAIHFLIMYFIFTTLGLFFLTSIEIQTDSVMSDLLFIFLFALFPYYMRGKEFQYQKLSGELYASPSLIMLSQLPITKNVLTLSRMIVYFFQSVPFQLIMLILLYAVNPDFQDAMSPFTYVSFCVIWLSFGIYVGYIMPSSDSGDIVNGKIMFIYSVALIGGFIVFYQTFNWLSDYSILQWTIIFTQNQPILSACLSIILAILGFKFWQHYTKKNMEKLDYL